MDWNKIEQLLNIGHAAAAHGPKYTPIVSAVQVELEEHVAAAQKMIEAKVKAAEEYAGRLRADAANKAREEKQAEEDKARSAVGDATDEDDEPTPVRRI